MEKVDYRFTIKELPKTERPREKLLKYGSGHLSNAELLALIIRTGNRSRTAVELAQDILSNFGGLHSLMNLSVEEVRKIRGVGLAKGAQMRAVVELSKRLMRSTKGSREVVKSPQDVFNLIMPELSYLKQELFKIILLDVKNQVISTPLISKGGLTSSPVHPRDVFREAIRRSSAAIILVHNHPSGDPAPSSDDIRVTKRLLNSGKIVDIEVLDHIVIGSDSFVSMKDKQLI